MNERAAVVLIHQNEILLFRRKRKGEEYYVVPGGAIEGDESFEQAAVREMKEETGLTVTIERKLWDYTNPDNNAMEHYFLAHKFSGQLQITGQSELKRMAEGEEYELEWVSTYELRYMRMLPDAIKERVLQQFGKHWRWDKIVRDKLPDIIAKRGRTSIWHTASEAEFWQGLKDKLIEESTEFAKTEGIKEIADLLEVIDAIREYKKFGKKAVAEAKKKRLDERGGYKKRIFLEESTGE